MKGEEGRRRQNIGGEKAVEEDEKEKKSTNC